MSEFYVARRNAITDLTAFFAFIAGFVGAAPFAYSYIQVGFETQRIARGFAFFIGATMGAGLVLAAAGLALGRGIGWFWERSHRMLRHARGLESGETTSSSPLRHAPASAHPTLPHQEVHTADRTLPVLEFREGFDADTFLALLSRSGMTDRDPVETAKALAHTWNLGAWDGQQLVGAIRVLGDGYTWNVVTDLIVDPHYRRQGIGRELMTRATRKGRGSLTIASIPSGTEGFFRQINALPAYAAFLRGAKGRLN